MPQPNVDFGGTSNFVSHGKKKRTKAPDWTDDPPGESKNNDGDGQEGDANGGGAAGGDGAGGGAGGAGDNNGDGGEGAGGGEGWNSGGGKKKKKAKKASAWPDDEEDEQKKEAEAAESKREEEAAAAAAKPPGSFSWADDANAEANDGYGFTEAPTKKGKKGKKGKVFTLVRKGVVVANGLSIRMNRSFHPLSQSRRILSMKLTF